MRSPNVLRSRDYRGTRACVRVCICAGGGVCACVRVVVVCTCVHACVQGTGQAYQVLSSEGYDVFIIQDVFY